MDYLKHGKSLAKTLNKSGNLLLTGSLMVMAVSSGANAAPMSSIADSWHNLGAENSKSVTPNGDPSANSSFATAEICVFCHTPHGGDNNAAVPIWNRRLNNPEAYTRYSDLGTSTFDAQEVPVGSVSIACLSCHDGTQALDAMINWPGSGTGGGGVGIPGSSMTGSDLDPDGSLKEGIVQNLGVDLSNDHPIGMQYAGGGITAGDLFAATRDPDFTAASNEPHREGFTLMSKSAPSSSSITTLWWIERGTDSLNDADRDREDIILYTRKELDNVEQPFVECGSCHDPHNIDNPTFLRVSNGVAPGQRGDFPLPNGSPSGMCLSCHLK